jgi:hypothetical protein
MLATFGVLSIVCLFSAPVLLGEGRRDISIRWSELSKTVGSGKIRMVLPSGIRVECKVITVEPERLELQITRTEAPKIQQKGRTFVPRLAVPVVEMIKHGHRWRITGAIVGSMLTAVVAGSFLRYIGSDDLGQFVGFTSAGMAVSGVAGYYIGKQADRDVILIRIVPDVN